MRLRSSPSADAASVGREGRPGTACLAAFDQAAQEAGTRRVEAVEHLVERAIGGAQTIARVERRSLPEHAVQLEIGEGRPEDERAQVVTNRQLVVGHGELGVHRLLEHVGEQTGQRLPRGRVAVGEVLERGHVVRTREQLARAFLPVPSGAPDLLRVRLEPLRQIVVVDVANVGLVDPHPERDRRDHDPVGRPRPPLLHAHTVVGAHPGVVRAGRQAGAYEQLGDAQRAPLQRHVDDR